MKLYDLHTHSDNLVQSGVCAIYNLRIGSSEIPTAERGPFSAGIHPYDAHYATEEWFEHLATAIANPRCIAVGECGVDKLRQDIERQCEIFERQCAIAVQHNMPLIVHCVRAQSEILRSIRKFELPIIMHSYTKHTKELAALPHIYFSLSRRNIPHSDAIALDRVLLESDDSGIAIEQIYREFSEHRGIPYNELTMQIERNIKKIFKDNL